MIINKTRLNTSLFTDISSGAIDNIMSPNNHAVVPNIGDNGNWWVGNYDTGVSATGPQGDQGPQGESFDPADLDRITANEQNITSLQDLINAHTIAIINLQTEILETGSLLDKIEDIL